MVRSLRYSIQGHAPLLALRSETAPSHSTALSKRWNVLRGLMSARMDRRTRSRQILQSLAIEEFDFQEFGHPLESILVTSVRVLTFRVGLRLALLTQLFRTAPQRLRSPPWPVLPRT